MRFLITTVTACALISPLALITPVAAQTTAPSTQATPSTQASPAQSTAGQWRASKMKGVDVYNAQNQKLGEIDDLIIEPSGRIAGAVIGVGGFLGIDQHDVLIPMDQLKFSSDSGRTTTGSGSSRHWYPERAELNLSKDQLKAMPEFKY